MAVVTCPQHRSRDLAVSTADTGTGRLNRQASGVVPLTGSAKGSVSCRPGPGRLAVWPVEQSRLIRIPTGLGGREAGGGSLPVGFPAPDPVLAVATGPLATGAGHGALGADLAGPVLTFVSGRGPFVTWTEEQFGLASAQSRCQQPSGCGPPRSATRPGRGGGCSRCRKGPTCGARRRQATMPTPCSLSTGCGSGPERRHWSSRSPLIVRWGRPGHEPPSEPGTPPSNIGMGPGPLGPPDVSRP